MSRQLDEILVIDVESTCWNGPMPAGQVSEIIEIGICTIDVAALERREKRSILVRPERSAISPFCTELTTLRPEDFVGAGTLAEAAEILREDYRSRKRLWASWGEYDRQQFEKVCRRQAVDYPFGTGHLNVKTLYATAMGHQRELGMAAACREIGLELEGIHHRGVDDAWNIGGVLCHLFRRIRGVG